MNQQFTITLSSKNQFTLPVAFTKSINWSAGQKFNLSIDDENTLVLKKTLDPLLEISKITQKYKLPKVKVENAIQETRKLNKQKYNYDN